MEKDIVCPYCGEIHTNNPEEFDSGIYHCGYCENAFQLVVEVKASKTYSTYSIDSNPV